MYNAGDLADISSFEGVAGLSSCGSFEASSENVFENDFGPFRRPVPVHERPKITASVHGSTMKGSTTTMVISAIDEEARESSVASLPPRYIQGAPLWDLAI